MEGSRSASTAQLAQWTKAKNNVAPQPVDEDEYDEEFEDYEDEFEEEEEEEKPAPAPAPVSRAPPARATPAPTSTGSSARDMYESNHRQEETKSSYNPVTAFQNVPRPGSSSSGRSRPDAPRVSVSSVYNDSNAQPSHDDSRRQPTVESKDVGPNAPSSSSRISPGVTVVGTTTVVNTKNTTDSLLADPRLVRVRRILASGVLDMKENRSTLLTLAPTSPYEFYLQKLHRSSTEEVGGLRQIGVPLDEDKRDVETTTDHPTMVDASMQFTYGDDTELFNLFDRIKASRNTQPPDVAEDKDSQSSSKRQSKGSKSSSRDTDSIPVPVAPVSTPVVAQPKLASREESSDTNHSSGGSFSLFLQRTTGIFEALLKEAEQSEAKQSKSSRGDVGKSSSLRILEGSSWVECNYGETTPEKIVLGQRPCSFVVFSELTPNCFATIHPFVELSEDVDFLPHKSLIALWDSFEPKSPTLILECVGEVTALTFSNTHSHFILAATNDGTIHLWDLRERAQHHLINVPNKKKGSDIMVTSGIRKPTFSTFFSLDDIDDDSAPSQHLCSVLAVSSVGPLPNLNNPGSSMVSQFSSLDESGTMLFWAVSDSSSGASLRRSPWGDVSLIITKAISDVFSRDSSSTSTSSRRRKTNNSFDTLFDPYSTSLTNAIMAPVATESLSVVVTGTHGDLRVIRRNGGIGTSMSRQSAVRSENYVAGPSVRGYWQVTAVAVRSPESSTSVINTLPKSSLVLGGRADGSLDLFSLDSPLPLRTWTLSSNSSKNKRPSLDDFSCAVIAVRWLVEPVGSIVALTADGVVHYINLLIQDAPVHRESLDLPANSLPLSLGSATISSASSTLDYVKVAVVTANGLRLRQLSFSVSLDYPRLVTTSAYTAKEDEFYSALLHLLPSTRADTKISCPQNTGNETP